MNRKKTRLWMTLLVLALSLPMAIAHAATTITSNQFGTHDGYDYEFWSAGTGTGMMTLNSGGAFSAQWSGTDSILMRKGKRFDLTKTHQQIGNISLAYDASFNTTGNAYLAVYGWTDNPLVEYFIVESWGTVRPTGTKMGTITVNQGTYDVYRTTQTSGSQTYIQYWSVRTSKRTSGTVSVSEHFYKWQSLGMNLGKLYEVSLLVEGLQGSNGSANVTTNVLTIS